MARKGKTAAAPLVQFTYEDVRKIVGKAQEAPLANLREAAALSDLLQRFDLWARGQFEPTEEPEDPTA